MRENAMKSSPVRALADLEVGCGIASADSSSLARVPNFFYLGTSKAGSTWLYGVLCRHEDICMAPGKGLYFFENNFDRGLDWYLAHFRDTGRRPVIGEIAHSYLYAPLACERIAQVSPQAKLMVCLREPASRAFSAYLDACKNNQYGGTFEQALQEIPSLVERGRYAKYLAPYVARFGRAQIHVGIFDDLERDPQTFASQVFAFLGVADLALPGALCRKMMPAGRPRAKLLALLARRGSMALKRLGMRRIRGRLKTSRVLRNLIYRPFDAASRPQMAAATRSSLRERFFDDVHRLDGLLGSNLKQRWGYAV